MLAFTSPARHAPHENTLEITQTKQGHQTWLRCIAVNDVMKFREQAVRVECKHDGMAATGHEFAVTSAARSSVLRILSRPKVKRLSTYPHECR